MPPSGALAVNRGSQKRGRDSSFEEALVRPRRRLSGDGVAGGDEVIVMGSSDDEYQDDNDGGEEEDDEEEEDEGQEA